MPTALQLADAILGSGLSDVVLDEFVVDALIERGDSPPFAIEAAAGLLPDVRNHIQVRLDGMLAKGIERPLVWFDIGSRTMLVHPSIMAGETPPVRGVSQVRAEIHTAMKGLTGVEFEVLIRSVLTWYGLSPARYAMTGRSKDGGIDFCAEWIPDQLQRNRLGRTRWRILGQAKLLWDATVGPNDVKAFAKVVDDFRNDRRVRRKVPEWFKTLDYPVLGLFVTAGRLGPSARELARDNIVVAIEGDQLADDLRAHPAIVAAMSSNDAIDVGVLRGIFAG